VVSAAAALRLANGSIEEARIALGGVAPKPWRVREAEEALRGARADSASFHDAAATVLAGAKPSGDNAFKIELARRIMARALALAAAAARPTLAASARAPRKTSSASCARQGLSATPPSAMRASLIVAFSMRTVAAADTTANA